jgi:hypothetical protein
MKTLLPIVPLLIILLLFATPSAASAGTGSFEQRCEREMLPSFTVTSRDPGFKVHNTVSSHMLNTRGTYNVAGQAMMGMTASFTRAEVGIDGPSLRDLASGRECLAPHVSVDLAYVPLDVYIAREFHPLTCSYREVLAHEMRHVQMYRDNLPQIEKVVREELIKRYGNKPLYAPAGRGLDELQKQVDEWLRPLIAAELAKIEVLQRGLDNPEENFRLSHTCMGEMETAMGSSF